MRIVLAALRVVLFFGAAFLAIGAWVKIDDIRVFASTIASHRAVSEDAAPLMAWLIVSVELLAAVVIIHDVIIKSWIRRGSALLAVLFTVFALYAMYLTINPPPVPQPCGCGLSRRPVESWLPLCLRNAVLACVCGGMALLSSRFEVPVAAVARHSPDGKPGRRPMGAASAIGPEAGMCRGCFTEAAWVRDLVSRPLKETPRC